jgi:hypothetical protein
MFRFGIYYQMDLLNIFYNNQHFEPIEYICDAKSSQFQFEIKINYSFINLDNYSTISKPMKKKYKQLPEKYIFIGMTI